MLNRKSMKGCIAVPIGKKSFGGTGLVGSLSKAL
nr:MAG TPA: hypothetical protein [Caudoviricetes sp.]